MQIIPTLMAGSKVELKVVSMRVKAERAKSGLKLNIQKMKIMAFSPITSWQIDGKSGNSDRFYFLEFQNHYRWTAATKLTNACSLEEKL